MGYGRWNWWDEVDVSPAQSERILLAMAAVEAVTPQEPSYFFWLGKEAESL